MGKKKASEPSAHRPEEASSSPPLKVSGDGSVHLPNVELPDVGDETQLRFRYQNAYGILILIGMKQGKYPFEKLLCEYHDDFIGVSQSYIASFQVKTQQPERGFWQNNTPGFVDAVGKFIELERRYQGVIQKYFFVSNTSVLPSRTGDKKKNKSPEYLLSCVSSSETVDALTPLGKAAFSTLADSIIRKKAKGSNPVEHYGITADKVGSDSDAAPASSDDSQEEKNHLFRVLKKMVILQGPSLSDYESAIVDSLISVAPAQPGPELRIIRDELIHKIFAASSKSVPPEKRYIIPVGDSEYNDPIFDSKIVGINDLEGAISYTASRPPFRFSPTGKEHFLSTERNPKHFDQKMERGGVVEGHLETMRRRKNSAEEYLLELQAKKSGSELDEFEGELNHLDQKIQGVCDDASLEFTEQVTRKNTPYGLRMLRKVQTDVDSLVKEQPQSVCGFDYECLMGVVGLLTESCSVWWSPKFNFESSNDLSNS